MLSPTWQGPFGGVPPFDAVQPDLFVDSFRSALAKAEGEINSIANCPEPATFENTLVALERANKQLQNISALFGVHTNNLNIGPVQQAEVVVQPMLAEFEDKVNQNANLFRRINDVFAWASTPSANLTSEQRRLLKHKHEEFARNGALLNKEDKEKLTNINQRLASLFTTFSQNLLQEEKEITIVDSEKQLQGLPASVVAGFAVAGKAVREGCWAIQNTRSSVEPLLTYASDRQLREVVWRKFVNRGANENNFNNYDSIREIVQLRADRARLLGYPSHAHWRVETEMAKTPEAALALLQQVWPKAVAQVKREVANMLVVAQKIDGVTSIEPWDYRYYAEKVRLAHYDFDFNLLTPYLDADRLRDGLFWVAGELYSLDFDPVTNIPVFHPDVKVWEVKNRLSGQHVGLWYFDPFCREGKRSGAWMTAYRSQSSLLGETSIVSNNCNYVKVQPALISWDDAITMFHEFGHALHGLLSQVTYPTLSGTNVARDFVEFPSQLNEHWLETSAILEKFALHHETGEAIPKEIVAKIKATANFNQGFKTVEYLSCALYDMQLHMIADSNALLNPQAFEEATMKALGMPQEIVMRHRPAHFAHIFSTDSYSAGYYSYMWADTLVADAAEAFEESPGKYFDKETAARYLEHVLTKGNSVDPLDAFRAFRGRDVDTKALLRKRGFPTD